MQSHLRYKTDTEQSALFDAKTIGSISEFATSTRDAALVAAFTEYVVMSAALDKKQRFLKSGQFAS